MAAFGARNVREGLRAFVFIILLLAIVVGVVQKLVDAFNPKQPEAPAPQPDIPTKTEPARREVDLSELSEGETRALVDSYDPSKLTPAHRRLATVLVSKMDEIFGIAERAGLLSSATGSIGNAKLEERSSETKGISPDVAGLFATHAQRAFSPERFATLVADHQRARASGWALGYMFAMWQSLGRLCLLVAATAAYKDPNRALRALKQSEPFVLDAWKKSRHPFNALRFQAAMYEEVGESFDAFTSCRNGTALFSFFGRRVNRILGNPETIVVQGERITASADPIQATAVAGYFIQVCSATKELFEKADT